MLKGAKPAPVRTFIQKALRVQITNNLVEGYFLKVVKKSNALHLDYYLNKNQTFWPCYGYHYEKSWGELVKKCHWRYVTDVTKRHYVKIDT